MNHDKIREIIYSKCKVYRKEEENPFKDRTIEAFAWYVEKTMMNFRIGNLENRYKDYASLTDDKIANLVVENILTRSFLKSPKAERPYSQLKSLPFLSE